MPAKFLQIKNSVLGKKYDLSVAFLSVPKMRLAMKHRYKKIAGKKTSNVLSFPLSKSSGEILICKQVATPYSPGYLFIHGCLHLKGYTHSATMERIEGRLVKKFGFRMHE